MGRKRKIEPWKSLRPVEFHATPEMRKILTALQQFYKLKTRSKLLEQMVLLCVCDVASLNGCDKDWTDAQRTGFQSCCSAAEAFAESLVTIAAKKVLAKQKPTAQMSVEELIHLTRKELVAKAKQAGLNTKSVPRTSLIKELSR